MDPAFFVARPNLESEKEGTKEKAKKTEKTGFGRDSRRAISRTELREFVTPVVAYFRSEARRLDRPK
jgi:hypothetical protein